MSDRPIVPGNLDYLRKQAKALLRDARAGEADALRRLGDVTKPTLADAQRIIAREAGFASWPKLQDELRWRADAKAKHKPGSAKPGTAGHAGKTPINCLGPIDQVGLACTDLEAAERFYSGLLGLRLAGAVPETMKFFDCDGLRLVLFKTPTVPPNSIIYFRVPPKPGLLHDTVATLKANNVKIESDPHLIARNWNGHDIWLAFFRDPFDNLLALKCDLPTGGKP